MSIQRTTTLETLHGLGGVIKEGQPIATVRYDLRVSQAVHVHRTLREVSETPGLKSAAGYFSVVDGDKWSMDAGIELTLQVEDGRKTRFFINSANPVQNRFRIVISGDWLSDE